MELQVLEESKSKMVFKLPGETHTFCNALKHELELMDGVVTVAYRIDHPLTGILQFLLETKGLEPRKALKQAVTALKKKVQEFQKEVSAKL